MAEWTIPLVINQLLMGRLQDFGVGEGVSVGVEDEVGVEDGGVDGGEVGAEEVLVGK